MSTLITVLHVIVCLFLMLTVLLQSGKGGGMGGAFGGSNAGTVFGGSGASTFLRKLTAGAATVFMLTSMVLAFIASHNAADALEKFGASQQKAAKEKDQARKDALKNQGSGSAGSAAPSMAPHVIDMGSASPEMGGSGGSATTPAEAPETGSGGGTVTPAQPTMGTPPAAGSAEKPATPPAAGSATAPTTAPGKAPATEKAPAATPEKAPAATPEKAPEKAPAPTSPTPSGQN